MVFLVVQIMFPSVFAICTDNVNESNNRVQLRPSTSVTLRSNLIWHKLHHDAAIHYNDVIMGDIASQTTSLTIDYSIVYSDADQRKHQSSASLAFVRGIHRGPVNSPHKRPVTRKMFPYDDVIMKLASNLVLWGELCGIFSRWVTHSPILAFWLQQLLFAEGRRCEKELL